MFLPREIFSLNLRREEEEVEENNTMRNSTFFTL
jgi:hypothetical protein